MNQRGITDCVEEKRGYKTLYQIRNDPTGFVCHGNMEQSRRFAGIDWRIIPVDMCIKNHAEFNERRR